MEKYYDQEINLRMNFAASSDIFRAKFESDFGGDYFEIDVLSSLKSDIYFLDNDLDLLKIISEDRFLIQRTNLSFIEWMGKINYSIEGSSGTYLLSVSTGALYNIKSTGNGSWIIDASSVNGSVSLAQNEITVGNIVIHFGGISPAQVGISNAYFKNNFVFAGHEDGFIILLKSPVRKSLVQVLQKNASNSYLLHSNYEKCTIAWYIECFYC